MEITVDTRPLAKIDTEALVTYAFEQEKPIDSGVLALDAAMLVVCSSVVSCESWPMNWLGSLG